MQFITRDERGPYDTPERPASLPCVVLLHNHQWNDYGYRTNFHIYFFDEHGTRHSLGDVKILQHHAFYTRLPSSFETLGEQFCSLGDSLEYYKDWIEKDSNSARQVFSALRDVVAEPQNANRFIGQTGFEDSLLRFSEARKAYREGGKLFGRRIPPPEDGFDFKFSCELKGFTRPHELSLEFTKKEGLPHRIVTFVGKNGTGKTGVLSKLAGALSGWELKAGHFTPDPPLFSRVIAISYSMFQPFDAPFDNTKSYRYCGIRNAQGKVEIPSLDEYTALGLKEVITQRRHETWQELMCLEDIFGPEATDNFTADIESFQKTLGTLSSGQRIIASIVTDILQNIEEQSLILFDEPEAYLHPTLISTLMRLLHKLLDQYDSYAVVATHSPIVVQEIPARSTKVFERQGSIPIQGELPIESFGENLTGIVDHVFAMNEDDKNYKSILSDLLNTHTHDEVLALFDERLGLNARMALLALQKGRKP
ncbi:AAA family ATPase [Myxococcus xanthus]|uniref:AAA family ATPase n=1 Tax=Myxococcus xanthus TaxID=34 RepID=UPI001917679B|nr:AAA family ATPase [Myxococcus xanthus]QQR42401.1 AAA family ATPase [Myxococcus xanthus]